MVDKDWLDAIRRFRDENKLTQHDLAKFLGVSQKTVSRWECGVDQPGAETRARLKALLDGGGTGLPSIYEAVREAAVPIALVDGRGNILVASRLFQGGNGGGEAPKGAKPLPTILVIEDDDAVLRATTAVLKQWQFLSVGVADGEEAVKLLAEGVLCPDGAIIDFLLPGAMDGVATAEKLRAYIPDLPILIISGETRSESMERITASKLPFIRKPVDPNAIRTALQMMVRYTPPAP